MCKAKQKQNLFKTKQNLPGNFSVLFISVISPESIVTSKYKSQVRKCEHIKSTMTHLKSNDIKGLRSIK